MVATLCALVLGLTLLVSPSRAAAFDLDALMASLAQVKSGEATFTEKRTVFQLDQTLESSGRLSFAAPDSFTRETLKPRRDRMAVVGNQLTVSQGSRSRSTTLDSVPEAVVIVEAIRGTLTGNRETLERYFTTQLLGGAERWSLDLVPRDARLRGQVAQVRVSGRQGQLREVQITMTDGDRSVMQIEPVTAERSP
ncbi:LolA family protein [Sphaerotilus sp.]|uniref:LolA family protein n=1 Tax=Sphaerotilus sp. TaxID=2093942 RepID=UPI0038F6BE83